MVFLRGRCMVREKARRIRGDRSPRQSPLERNGARGSAPGHGGFTIIELVLTIMILGIIAAVVSQFALQGIRSYSTEQDRGNVHSQARLAVERVVRESRAIRSCADIDGPANPSAVLSFTDITGAAVVFSVVGTNLTRGGATLAQGVDVTSATPFRFLDMNGAPSTSCPLPSNPSAATDIWFVEIDLTCAQGNEKLHLRSRVHPRNFQ